MLELSKGGWTRVWELNIPPPLNWINRSLMLTITIVWRSSWSLALITLRRPFGTWHMCELRFGVLVDRELCLKTLIVRIFPRATKSKLKEVLERECTTGYCLSINCLG